MKKIMLLLPVVILMCTTQMQAQNRERARARTQTAETRENKTRENAPRELKILVRDTLGNRMPEVDVAAAFRGSGRGLEMSRRDAAGDHFFTVTDADTLDLLVFDMLFEIVAEGTDSLLVMSRIPPLADRPEQVYDIEAVTVSASRQGRQQVNIGYGSRAVEDIVSWGQVIDMKEAEKYIYILEYLIPRIRYSGPGPGLIVIDGVPFDGTMRNLEYYPLANVESIYFDKMGTIYGARGAGGVLFITSKGSR